MKGRCRGRRVLMSGLVVLALFPASFVVAADVSHETLVRHILTTIRAFRTVYMNTVLEQVKKAGVEPKQDWKADDHGVMLPFEFVKAAGSEIQDFELGLISLAPLNKANLPKTQAEADALKAMTANPQQPMITFIDGIQYKGVLADYAISQACSDCHNAQGPKTDFKKGDMIGAIVVRILR